MAPHHRAAPQKPAMKASDADRIHGTGSHHRANSRSVSAASSSGIESSDKRGAAVDVVAIHHRYVDKSHGLVGSANDIFRARFASLRMVLTADPGPEDYLFQIIGQSTNEQRVRNHRRRSRTDSGSSGFLTALQT